MRQPAPVRAVAKALRIDLAGWAMPEGWRKPVRVVCPPALTKQTYNGVTLSRVIVPTCSLPAKQLDEQFCELVEWHSNGKPKEGKSSLLQGNTKRIKEFVKYSPARFTLWASQQRDMRLTSSSTSIMCEGEVTIGLAEGMVVGSRIYTEFPFTLDGLDEPIQYTCKEPAFYALWNRANMLGRMDARDALAAVKAYSGQPLIKMFPWIGRSDLGNNTIEEIGEALASSIDPIGDIYLLLVPDHTSRAYYERVVGKLLQRPLDPPEEVRAHIWEKLRSAALI